MVQRRRRRWPARDRRRGGRQEPVGWSGAGRIACPRCRCRATAPVRAGRARGAGRMVMVRTAPLTYGPPSTAILATARLRAAPCRSAPAPAPVGVAVVALDDVG